MNDQLPEITIVMPVRNEVAAIEAALDSVLAQVVDAPFEVVVAEGRSTDGTRELLERRAADDYRIRIVDNPQRGTPQALNRALAAARGRFLVRVDGHATVPPDYVQRLVDHLRSGACHAAGGRKQGVGRSEFGRAVAAVQSSRLGIGDSRYHYADKVQLVDHVPFGAYLTERARAIGGWDERFVRNQDYEFDYRYGKAGGLLLLDPSIVVYWNVRETPAALARQYFGYGFWKLRTLAQHPESLHPRWLVPPTLVTSLAAGALASRSRTGRRLLAATAAAYGAFLAIGATSIAGRALVRRSDTALALATIHLSWGVGFLASGIAAARRRLLG